MLDDEPELGISLPEAARRYGLSVRTLAQRVRVGEISGYKVQGLRGREWRVLPSQLEAVRHGPASSAPQDPQPAQQTGLHQTAAKDPHSPETKGPPVRPGALGNAPSDGPSGEGVEAEVDALRRYVRVLEGQLAAERRKGLQADRQLGEALMEIGRLRAAAERRPGSAEPEASLPGGVMDLRIHACRSAPGPAGRPTEP